MILLTGEQREAVAHQGNLLLTACPGSGKTRTLLSKLVTEIEGVRGSPRDIACITYTNTAVQEIEQRAKEQLQPGDDQYFTVCTIHSFCLNQVVRPYGWLSPDWQGGRKILTPDTAAFEEICDYAAAQVNLLQLQRRDYEAFEGLSLNAAGQIIGLAAKNAAVSQAAPHFWAKCAELGYLDFSTIIYEAYCLLRDHPQIARSLCARFAWFLVDEFQDTTELQIEILKILHATGRSRFFMVGDLAQSIYGFTGARPELVQPFGQEIGARADLALHGNFRSSQRVVDHAERLFPRDPAMIATGPNRNYPAEPILVTGLNTFQAITEQFLPAVESAGIGLGDATVLATGWPTLFQLARQLREYGTPIVGPGARPYKRSRLFAQLAEQFCGAITDPNPETTRQLERALFHAVLDVTGHPRLDVFSHEGRVVLVRLMREAKQLAEQNLGAVAWLDAMSMATGEILRGAEYVDQEQSGLFYASVQEMKKDMQQQQVDLANLSVDDLGLFASPSRALRLSTIHFAKGREYDAVAIVGVREGTLPFFAADDIQEEKRKFYVALTRARKLLMYIYEPDNWGNGPSRFLGSGGLNII